MTEEAQWDLAVDGERHGPFQADQIVQAVRERRIAASTPVALHGSADWAEIAATEPFRTRLAADTARVEGVSAAGKGATTPGTATPDKWMARLRGVGVIFTAAAVLLLLGVIAWKQIRGQTRDPADISAEMMPVLLDVAATERARKCDEFLGNLAEFREAKPFEIAVITEDVCRLVPKGKPDSVVAGGFYVTQFEDCGKLKTRLPNALADHENNLDVKARLYCSKERKPSLDTDDESVRLAAELSLGAKLPAVVTRVNDGRTSPRIKRCYFEVKAHLLEAEKRVRKLRCSVITSDAEVAKVTYDAVWSRARLKGRLEDYQKENKELWEALSKQDKERQFFDRFTAHQRTKACRDEDAPSLEEQEKAADLALETCL